MSKPTKRQRAERRALRARQYAQSLRTDMLAKRCPGTAVSGSFLDGFGTADRIVGEPNMLQTRLFNGRANRVR